MAVVSQWAAEIKKMADGLIVVEHHGTSRTTGMRFILLTFVSANSPAPKSDPVKLRAADVVITSYNVVASEHGTYAPDAKDEGKGKGKAAKTKSAADSEDDDDSDDAIARHLQRNKKSVARAPKKKDALFHVKWWRVVLGEPHFRAAWLVNLDLIQIDEAHNIKNKTTKSAQGCYALEAKYRWCLTGTPMQNNVEELYSLLKFLRLRPLDDWNEFKVKIAQPIKNGRPQRAIKRLHVRYQLFSSLHALSHINIRRWC